MNRKYGIVKLNENELFNITKPEGFIVREKYVEGKPVSFEYGIYIDENTFFSVPMHFSLKDKLIPMNVQDVQDVSEYRYYMVPEQIQFGVKTYANKKGKVNPILVEASEKNPAVFISCWAWRDNANSIVNVTIDPDTRVIRKYIDKDRKVIAMIMFNTKSDSYNPMTSVDLQYGVIGTNTLYSATYKFSVDIEAGQRREQNDTVNTNSPVETKFINLPQWTSTFKKKDSVKKQKNFNNANSEKDVDSAE